MEASQQSGRAVRFGAFELDFAAGELRKNGLKVRLQDQPFQLLAALVGRPGEVVTREHLLDLVWGDTIVTDHVLTRSISELRKVFGDTPHHPAVIETIPKTGYRLIAPVTKPDPDFAPHEATRNYPGDSAPPNASDIAITASSPVPGAARPQPVRARSPKLALVGLVGVRRPAPATTP